MTSGAGMGSPKAWFEKQFAKPDCEGFFMLFSLLNAGCRASNVTRQQTHRVSKKVNN